MSVYSEVVVYAKVLANRTASDVAGLAAAVLAEMGDERTSRGGWLAYRFCEALVHGADQHVMDGTKGSVVLWGGVWAALTDDDRTVFDDAVHSLLPMAVLGAQRRVLRDVRLSISVEESGRTEHYGFTVEGPVPAVRYLGSTPT